MATIAHTASPQHLSCCRAREEAEEEERSERVLFSPISLLCRTSGIIYCILSVSILYLQDVYYVVYFFLFFLFFSSVPVNVFFNAKFRQNVKNKNKRGCSEAIFSLSLSLLKKNPANFENKYFEKV